MSARDRGERRMAAIDRGWEDAKAGRPCPYKEGGAWSLAPFWWIGARYFAAGKDARGAPILDKPK